MPKQTIIWTVLPNGATGTVRHLSVLVTPRLTEPSTQNLAEYPDFDDWPATNLSFSVEVAGGGTFPAVQTSEMPDSRAWKALFKADSLVRGHVYKRQDLRRIASFPVRHINSFVRGLVVGLHTGEFDGSEIDVNDTRLRFPLREVQYRSGINEGIAKVIEDVPKAAVWDSTPEPRAPIDFAQALLFHKPRNREVIENGRKRTRFVPTPPRPKLDVHDVFAALLDHSPLLRKLGLLIDLDVDLGSRPGGVYRMRVVPTWSSKLGPNSSDVTPFTRTRMDTGVFRAEPEAVTGGLPDPDELSELDAGLLKLDDPKLFTVLDLDVDAAAVRTIEFANMVHRTETSETRLVRTTPPAYRSGGISVARTNRARRLRTRTERQATHNRLIEQVRHPDLDADDLVRGYAVDVYDETAGAWFPLCARVGTYVLPDIPPIENIPSEGAVVLAATTDTENPDGDIFVQETMWSWKGWSLAAPTPMLAVRPDGTIGRAENAAVTPFGLSATYRAQAGTLPRLRFGRSYRMRARAVDLAGNSREFDQTPPDESHATPPVRYRRYEPVAVPHVLLDSPPVPGESEERVVLLSDVDKPGWVTAPRRRLLAPPKNSMRMAELHGFFDAEVTGRPITDPATYGQIAGRENASLETLGQPVEGAPGNRYYPDDELTVPYLPDPMAHAVSFRGLPNADPNEVFLVNLTGAWPDRRAVRMDVVDGTAPPQVLDGRLILSVPKGRTYRVRVSSALDNSNLLLFGQFNWLHESGLSDELEDLARKGILWAITPSREIVVVNATRRPTKVPVWLSLDLAERDPGDTSAVVTGKLSLSTSSTSKVDIFATWDEFVDAPGGPAPEKRPAEAHVKELAVSDDERLELPPEERPVPDELRVGVRQGFGDTKRRRVSYSATAFSRYAEHFRERESVMFGFSDEVTLSKHPIVPGSETLTADGVHFNRGSDYTIEPETGVIRRTARSRIATRRQVEVTFLVPPHTQDMKIALPVDIPSSSRPPAPAIRYVIPAFGWNSSADASGAKSTRTGGILRVYFERGWFASGRDEMLGVVFWPQQGGPPGFAQGVVTQAGADPMWESPSVRANLFGSHFPRATVVRSAKLDELPGFDIGVAGHPITIEDNYDADRSLWFCDIKIDAGPSYFPFVRLALARFQPHSVAGAELSRVVLSDFAQLTPDRSASVTYIGVVPGNPPLQRSTVTVKGASYRHGAGDLGSSLMYVGLQEKEPGVSDPDLGWRDLSEFPGNEMPALGNPSAATWSGVISFPANREPGQYRLVIREYERHQAMPGDQIVNARRLVYVDTIPL